MAAEFVTPYKQQRLIRTARYWLSRHNEDTPCRFDVLELYAPKGERGMLRIHHIEDAFDATN